MSRENIWWQSTTERIKRGWRPAVSYLEVEDDGPDEAEGELGVAVHDVLPSDVDQLDLLVPEVQKG